MIEEHTPASRRGVSDHGSSSSKSRQAANESNGGSPDGVSVMAAQLVQYLKSLQPEADVLDKPVEEAIRIYVPLFEFLMEKTAIGDLNKALASQHAYQTLHRCSVRDVKQAHRQRTAVCGTAIKVLAWTWFRANGLTKADKDEAVDVLMEVFFECEQEGSKSLQSIAQLCVWGLSSVGGKFPADGGRFKRVLEVARLSNHENVFGSERIQTESCRLLKSLAVNNMDALMFHGLDWIVPVLKSLGHRSEKMRTLALEGLLAGLNCVWPQLDEIRERLGITECATWPLLEAFFNDALKTSVGSSERIHVASCYGIVIFLFHSLLCADLKLLNNALAVADSIFAQASAERLSLLRQWRFVTEAFCESDAALQASAKKLHMPIRTVLREGHEPEAKVRREALSTWSHLASIALLVHGRSNSERSREMLRDLFRTLTRALGDADAQVRGPAVEFASVLIRKGQQSSSGAVDDDHSVRLRRTALLEGRVMFPEHYFSPTNAPFPEITDLCQFLDATLKEYPDLGEERALSLFRETTPLWSCALTQRTQPMKKPGVLPGALAERALASLRTLQAESVALALAQIEKDLKDDKALTLAVSRAQIAECLLEASEGLILAEENKSASTVASICRWLFPGNEITGHAFLLESFMPLKLWTAVGMHFAFTTNGNEVSDWLDVIFKSSSLWQEQLAGPWGERAFQVFEELLTSCDLSRLLRTIASMDASTNTFSAFALRCFASVCKQVTEAEHLCLLAEYLGNLLSRDERLGVAPSKRSMLGDLMNCAGLLIQRAPGDILGTILGFLFLPPCDGLLARIFASTVVPRMQNDFSWNVFAAALEQALRSSDRSVRSIAQAHCEDRPGDVPAAIKHLLSRTVPLNSNGGATTPRATIPRTSTPTSSSSARALQTSALGLSESKRPRVAEERDRQDVGVATYTNLDPSQMPVDSDDCPTEVVVPSERAVTTTQDPPPLQGTDLVIHEMHRLGQILRSTEVSACVHEAFRAAAGDLVRELFEAVSRRPV